MRIINKQLEIVDDHWNVIADDAELPASGAVIISFARWQKERDALLARGNIGVSVNGSTAPETVVADMQHFPLIALEFSKFTDGRCFSHARILRRLGYGGELRAIGDVWRDQLDFMRRCGIDSFAVREDKNIEDALNGFKDFTVRYQPAADGAPPIYKHR